MTQAGSMTTQDVADRLVALCREGKIEEAQRELYADNAINIEPFGTAAFPERTQGLDAIIEKGHRFGALIEQVHAMTFSEPLVAGQAFACAMKLDLTIKGRGRMSVEELGIYQVEDGKIVSERFTSRFDL